MTTQLDAESASKLSGVPGGADATTVAPSHLDAAMVSGGLRQLQRRLSGRSRPASGWRTWANNGLVRPEFVILCVLAPQGGRCLFVPTLLKGDRQNALK